MKTMFGTLKAVFAVAILATVFGSLANAQCGCLETIKRNASLLRQPFFSDQLSPALSSVAANGAEDSQGANQNAIFGFWIDSSIVGFWKVNFTSKDNPGIPDGTVLDSGFSQWHDDRTEILNSSRPPSTQSFCLGVWEHKGQFQYELNHFAISWNPDGTLLGPANIREKVTLSHDRDSYSGTFTIRQYDEGGNLLVQIGGQIEAKRITLKTSIEDVL